MLSLDRHTHIAICCCGSFTIFIGAQIVQAQEVCSEGEALTALSQLSCVADGAYLSPTAIATTISDQCSDANTEQRCNRCFRKSLKRLGKAFNELARADVLDRDWFLAVRSAVLDVQDATCSEIAPPQDQPEDLDSGRAGAGFRMPLQGHRSE